MGIAAIIILLIVLLTVGGDGGNQGSGNEMVQLVRSFLQMASGLKKDSDRVKQRVLQPENPYYVSREHAMIDGLREADTAAWNG